MTDTKNMYYLYDENFFMGEYTLEELKDLFHCDKNIILRYSGNGLLYKMRYKFLNKYNEDFKKQWDNIRFKILKLIEDEREKRKPFSIWKN